MKRTITAKDILALGPCEEWTPERIKRVARGRERLTRLEFSRLRSVSVEDRLWVLLRKDFVSEKNLRLFACDCAERVLRRERRAGREPDKRSWRAIAVAREFARGRATKNELAAAWAAAWAAARAAAEAAAEAAARAAARAAAWAAAEAAAWAAVRAAAWAAAWAAAEAAEKKWQIRQLRKYL
jgi:hypothetical protein